MKSKLKINPAYIEWQRQNERWREDCEIRYWLASGADCPNYRLQLKARLSRKRGKASAESLINKLENYTT